MLQNRFQNFGLFDSNLTKEEKGVGFSNSKKDKKGGNPT
jgi:hypothetical protein